MKILHTMIRVADLEKSITFYTQMMGMSILDRFENNEDRYTLVFVGYQEGSVAIELTYHWDHHEYQLGNTFAQIKLGVKNIYATCDYIKAMGGMVTREPGPVKGQATPIAFITDPDAYQIELIQTN
ncbi:MAG: lactoylglutathione lyase [Psychromonas sp.]